MVCSPLLRLVIACACAAALTACTHPGHPLPAEMDVRTLDVGTYPVDRHHYDQNAGSNGGLLEAMRMSVAVVPSVRIDPKLDVGLESGADTEDDSGNYLADADKPVLDQYNLIGGFATVGADRGVPPGGTDPGPAATVVRNLVLRFPDANTAKRAASALETADFLVAPDQNQPLNLSRYPNADIHYRPGVPTVGAFLAHDEFVLAPYIQAPVADPAVLLNLVQQTFDAEIPVLDTFQPTPTPQVSTLQVDPDGLLARVLVTNRDNRTPDPINFAVYGPVALVSGADDEPTVQTAVGDAGVDAVALVDDGRVIRARDPAAATRLVGGLVGARTAGYVTAGPLGSPVPGVSCLQRGSRGVTTGPGPKYVCYLAYRRYVAEVSSDDDTDIRQKTAAQYALLANSM
ncbi:hypothetical protein [Nocardia sp. alder85J]|uniref:DUF7373 family lipoprotein n=1 Tax=Nocardia sp. alder85J TaxID=2862949 RepID=UPI001CD360D0|nr:hypothetical protein [Nocardia sp. alder85J]MCX4096233.1 hypothetical protein [Nocardia sp. alder85J]